MNFFYGISKEIINVTQNDMTYDLSQIVIKLDKFFFSKCEKIRIINLYKIYRYKMQNHQSKFEKHWLKCITSIHKFVTLIHPTQTKVV